MSLIKRVRIGSLLTDNNVFLAPLAGIGDISYRTLGRRFGAGLTFTEMVSAHGLVNRSEKTLELLRITKKERPTGIQIFGSNPEIMSTAASICSEFPADVIDINGGCSVQKVLKTGAGAKILQDPESFYNIVKACSDASLYPVSVKIRLGLTEDTINVLENALAAEAAGASMLTLHPRTAQDKYRGFARWEYIGAVKDSVKIPVCGNGDIKAPEDAVRMVRETGCDAVMVGRAAIGNPWIIAEIVRAFEVFPQPPDYAPPSKDEKIRCALEHLKMIVDLKGETRGVREVKRHLHRYLRGLPHVSKERESIFRIQSRSEAEEKLLGLLG
jgi:nifR3 family TIM-barrel protein